MTSFSQWARPAEPSSCRCENKERRGNQGFASVEEEEHEGEGGGSDNGAPHFAPKHPSQAVHVRVHKPAFPLAARQVFARVHARLLPASLLCVRGREGQGVRLGGVYLALDDVIILVDLQVVAGVAGDGAAVPVVEVAPSAAASELCIADQRLLAVDGFARVVHAATGGRAWRGRRRRKKRIEVGDGGMLEGRRGAEERENKKPQLEKHNNNLQTVSLQTDRTTTAVRQSIHQRLLCISNQ